VHSPARARVRGRRRSSERRWRRSGFSSPRSNMRSTARGWLQRRNKFQRTCLPPEFCTWARRTRSLQSRFRSRLRATKEFLRVRVEAVSLPSPFGGGAASRYLSFTWIRGKGCFVRSRKIHCQYTASAASDVSTLVAIVLTDDEEDVEAIVER